MAIKYHELCKLGYLYANLTNLSAVKMDMVKEVVGLVIDFFPYYRSRGEHEISTIEMLGHSEVNNSKRRDSTT